MHQSFNQEMLTCALPTSKTIGSFFGHGCFNLWLLTYYHSHGTWWWVECLRLIANCLLSFDKVSRVHFSIVLFLKCYLLLSKNCSCFQKIEFQFIEGTRINFCSLIWKIKICVYIRTHTYIHAYSYVHFANSNFKYKKIYISFYNIFIF